MKKLIILFIFTLIGCGGGSEQQAEQLTEEFNYQTKRLSMTISHKLLDSSQHVYLDNFYALVYASGKDVQRIDFNGDRFSHDKIIVENNSTTVDVYVFDNFKQTYYIDFQDGNDSFDITFIEFHGTISEEEYKYSKMISLDSCGGNQ